MHAFIVAYPFYTSKSCSKENAVELSFYDNQSIICYLEFGLKLDGLNLSGSRHDTLSRVIQFFTAFQWI